MRLVKNSLWNLSGAVVPAIAAMLTVPVVVARLGEAQYGLLTLVMSVVGYFALLDVNISQGSVKFLAEYHARNDHERVREVISLGTLMYATIGLIGGLGLLVFSDTLARTVFSVPAHLQTTAATALRWGGVGFAFGQLQSYLMSVPQSLGRYDAAARSEASFGTIASVCTVVIVLCGGGLIEITMARAALAIVNVTVLVRLIRRLLPWLSPMKPRREIWRNMLSFSMYSYLSRVAAVTYANADKLLIGALVDLKALALYAVPTLLANRLFSLVFRMGQVMLPEASRLAAQGETAALRQIYLSSGRVLLFLNASIACIFLLFGPELLHYWAGAAFGERAVQVLTLVTCAVLVDSLTNLPSLVNDGLGRPANTGLFALMRAGVGLAAAWIGVHTAGIAGVAFAGMVVSAVMSLAFLAWVHVRVIPVTLTNYARHAIVPSLLPFSLALVFSLMNQARSPMTLAVFFQCIVMAALLLAAYGWWVVLPHQLRERLVASWRRRRMGRTVQDV